MTTKRAAALVRDSVKPDAPPTEIADLLTEVIAKHDNCDPDEAREQAERMKDEVLTVLQHEVDALAEMGRPSLVGFNSSSEYLVQGAAFIEGTESEELKRFKKRRASLVEYVPALQALSPRRLEFLCKGILEALGVEKAVVTQYTRDEGIDFYGLWLPAELLFGTDHLPGPTKQLKVWLVGQTKRLDESAAGTPDLRDLVGAVCLAKGRAFASRAGSKYAGLAIRTADPVIVLFITTGRLSRDGWRLVESSGVVAMDGETLAAFLTDRKIGITDGAFNPDELNTWLDTTELGSHNIK